MKIISQIQTKIRSPVQRTDYITGVNLLANLHQIPVLIKKSYSTFLILSDKTVFTLYGKKITTSLRKLGKPIVISIIPPGEQQKNLRIFHKVTKPYFKNGFNRSACLICLGGGVISDIGGFLASVLLRGIASIYLPTTVLAQIDAAIGGKTGIDFWQSKKRMYKNMIGTFKQPDIVISDINVLSSLPEEEILNGLGEMVKYWVGWGSPPFHQIKQISQIGLINNESLANVVSNCQKIKLEIVQKDPFDELGEREKLNLGHTLGHAIEGVLNGKLSHGKAVSLGLVAAAKISLLKRMLSQKKYRIIVENIQNLGLPTKTMGINKKAVKLALKLDKKGGRFILIRDIGKLSSGVFVEEKIIDEAIIEIANQ